MWGGRGWRVLLLCMLCSLLLFHASHPLHAPLPAGRAARPFLPGPFLAQVAPSHTASPTHLGEKRKKSSEKLCFAAAVAATAALACSEAETEMEKRAAAKKPKRAKQGPGGSGSFQPKRNVRKGKARKR